MWLLTANISSPVGKITMWLLNSRRRMQWYRLHTLKAVTGKEWFQIHEHLPLSEDERNNLDTGVPNCLLMLRNDFNDLAFVRRSGCCATEPGYAGDIGAIEI